VPLEYISMFIAILIVRGDLEPQRVNKFRCQSA
jgi:hypothetical protein